MDIHRIVRGAEALRTVDRPANALARFVARVPPHSRLGRLLRGSWLGHPVHPLLVTVPLGAWTSAVVLDLTGARVAARRLVGLGLWTLPLATAAGLADYADLTAAQRRVGVLHAASNTVAGALFAASYACRRTGSHGKGMALSVAGMAVTSAAGTLGGHLAYAQGAGVYRFQAPPFVRRPEPVAEPVPTPQPTP